MSFTVRLASPEDADALCRLNDLFNGPGTVAEDVRSYLRVDHKEIIAVAQAGEAVIGFACAQVLYTFYEAQPIAEITELFVLPEYRKQGVATQLMRFLEKTCIEQFDVSEFKLLTGNDNLPAQRFYEHLGYSQEDETLYSK